MKKFRKKLMVMLLMGAVTASISCSKILDVEPKDTLDVSKNYRNVADADAAVIGIYGKFLGLAQSYILLNELRADLVDVTENADPLLRELSNHTVTAGNPYADPRLYYEVILNCNDVLNNFDKMLAEHRFTEAEYNLRYSDIAILRSWIYLHLGVQYGEIPYITNVPDNIKDTRDLKDYPKISFDKLLDTLVNFTSKLPYLEPYAYPSGTSILLTIDGNSTQKLFINKNLFLGDLYLWKGEYLESGKWYKRVLEAENSNPGNIEYQVDDYKVSYNSGNGIGYYQDENTINNSVSSGWRGIFGLPNTDRVWNKEWFWAMPYKVGFSTNPFLELCSAKWGKYLIKPSKAAIDYWNSENQVSGLPFDSRGRLSYTANSAGQLVITKFTDNSEGIVGGGKWGIYRTGGVHLRYAEAANRFGATKLGWALLNDGVRLTFKSFPGASPVNAAESESLRTPYPDPFRLDANWHWSRNIGVRTRANLPTYPKSLQSDMLGLEDKLIHEAALELAFEGQRWADLVRIARRRNDPAFLADKIYNKLLKAGDANAATTRAKLMNPANWYLPFDR